MNDNKRNNFVLVIIIESWNFYIPENQHLYVSASFLFFKNFAIRAISIGTRSLDPTYNKGNSNYSTILLGTT